MGNYAEELNDVQKEALKQFKKNLGNDLKPEDNDIILLRWLRAKNFNLKKAERLYRENLYARAVHLVDEYVDHYVKPEICQKYEFAAHLGYAKDGTPVSYIAMGRGDIRGFVMSLHSFDLSKYCSLVIESDLKKVREQRKKTGREINEILYIVDMENLSLRECCHTCVIEMGLDNFRMLQEHYPEIWKYVIIVNEATPELLLKYIDEDVLPAFLGGKKVDSNGDPMCSEFLKFGGPVPEKYYLRNRSPLQETDPGAESFFLLQRGFYNYPLVVREANSIQTIELRFEGGSVTTVLLYKPFGNDMENIDIPPRDEYINEHNESCEFRQVSPKQKLQAHLAPIDNFVLAPWPGIYVWKFDNSCNWLTSRKVICRFKVLPPGTPLASKYNMLGFTGLSRDTTSKP
ncbi:SEC14-like protein 2 [Uloborus diversus]|uniref:SEC14-like protein 2 n=1 Tax=Uloborus diversus TaxID=327109 RepID=UPI002409776D|nr:SEC14-like protein 2 [Uloborus diversus]